LKRDNGEAADETMEVAKQLGTGVRYSVKYFAARDCAPAPNTLAAALLLSSFRNKDFALFFCCFYTSA
jgi:hypothetical protein